MASSPTSAGQSCASAYHGLRMAEDEYLALPQDKPYLEYIDGWVLQKPLGDEEHGLLAGELIIRLGAYRTRFGGRVGPEIRARFAGANYRLPDVSYYAKGKPFGAQQPPTLAVEIRSLGQTRNELQAKCRFFRANGVDECWLFDSRLRTVELFSSEGEFILGGDQTLSSTTLPGFELALSDLFSVLASDE